MTTAAGPGRGLADLGALIAPASVAVVGASADPAGQSGRALANLLRTGYSGRLYAVNPRYDELSGVACYPTVSQIPDTIEAAYILRPAAAVLDALQDCADAGVRCAVVCTSGFAELGEEGRRLQQRIGELSRRTGLRVLGPNCIGVINVVDHYIGCPTFNITYDYTPGGVSILSHSGGTAVTLFNRAQGRGLGIRTVVSLGNEADLDVADLIAALVEDEATRVIALYVEEIRDAPAFLAAVEAAHVAGKPVVALKVGRSEVGRRVVLGHTGAMAGEHAVFASLMRRAGVLEVTSVDEFLLACRILTEPEPKGPRIGVVSPSGGECGYVADRAHARGLELPPPSAAVRDALAARLDFGSPANPLDLTGQVIGDVDLLDVLLAEYFADPAFDMILVAIPTWGPFDAERMLPHFVAAATAAGKPAVISAWSARGLTETAEQVLRASPIPAFDSADDAVDALALARRYWTTARLRDVPWTPRPAEPLPDAAADEYAIKRALAAAGVEVAREHLAQDDDEIRSAVSDLGTPVVVKLLASGVTHKSELGLVRLGVQDASQAVAAAAEMRRRADAAGLKVSGVLVARQESGLEMITGGVRDATFGPVTMIGAGGLFAEIVSDATFLRAPAHPDAVRRALTELRIHAVLAGARGTEYDLDALVETVVRISEVFAASPHLAELDINPVLVRPRDVGGAVVVDAVLRGAVPTTPDDET